MLRPDSESPFLLFDPDGRRLMAVGQLLGEAGDFPRFCCAQGNGELLTYFFGRGKREVVLRKGASEGISARLGTRWVSGHREWLLDW